MADTRCPFHLEAGGVQRPPHPAGAGKGAESRTGGRQSCQFGEQFGSPHLGILRRGETVEKPGIDPRVQQGQLFQGIADQQGQADPSVIQQQALEARVYRHILLEQGSGEGRQLRP